jgi:DNA helicase-2/ATP-dependent DNA helicase PcrA
VNPADDVSLTRVINVPARGIGATTVAALTAAARGRGSSIAQVLDALAVEEDAVELASGSRSRVQQFWEMIGRVRSEIGRATLADTVERILHDTGLSARLRADGTQESETRADNLDELVSAARELDLAEGAQIGLPAVEAFLERAALVSELDQVDGRRSAITLMTLHNSKGLEFPVVILVGMRSACSRTHVRSTTATSRRSAGSATSA